MKAISPNTGAKEIVVAEDQPAYSKYPAALYLDEDETMCLLSRWTFTDEERQAIANGEDFYLGILTGGKPVQPVLLQVGAEGWIVDNPNVYLCPKCWAEFSTPDKARIHIATCDKTVMPEFKGEA